MSCGHEREIRMRLRLLAGWAIVFVVGLGLGMMVRAQPTGLRRLVQDRGWWPSEDGPAKIRRLSLSLRDDDAHVRAAAAKHLAQIGSEAMPVLNAALADADARVRREVLYALADIG